MESVATHEQPRWIWVYGPTAEGPYTAAEIRKMIKREEFTPDALYWSDRHNEWRKVRAMMCEGHQERVAELRQAGVKRVEFEDSGTHEDCRICSELADKRFMIYETPDLPPKGCECTPWCRLVVIGVA